MDQSLAALPTLVTSTMYPGTEELLRGNNSLEDYYAHALRIPTRDSTGPHLPMSNHMCRSDST